MSTERTDFDESTASPANANAGEPNVGNLSADGALAPEQPSADDMVQDAASASEGGKEGSSVAESFGALKDRTVSARELKDRRRAHDQLSQQIQDDEARLADNRYILANFEAEVAHQNDIIGENQKALNAQTAQIKTLKQRYDQTKSDLSRMKKEHKKLEKTYEQRRDEAHDALTASKRALADIQAQARKAELAISDAQRDIMSLQVKADQSQDSAEKSKALSEIESLNVKLAQSKDDLVSLEPRQSAAQTKRAQDQAVYDGAAQALKDVKSKNDDDERALEKQLKEIDNDIDAGNEKAASLRKNIEAAQDRIAYCQEVKENPTTTEELARAIEQDRDTAEQIQSDIAQRETVHRDLKKRSRKAVAIIVLIAIAIIAIVACVFYFGTATYDAYDTHAALEDDIAVVDGNTNTV